MDRCAAHLADHFKISLQNNPTDWILIYHEITISMCFDFHMRHLKIVNNNFSAT